jgi:hypothetical protein
VSAIETAPLSAPNEHQRPAEVVGDEAHDLVLETLSSRIGIGQIVRISVHPERRGVGLSGTDADDGRQREQGRGRLSSGTCAHLVTFARRGTKPE